MIKIKAVNSTQISVDGELYTQIKPYLYQSAETGIKSGFVVEKGKAVKYSNMMDYIPVTWKENVKRYITYFIIVYFLLSFLMQVIYLIGSLIRNRIRGKEHVQITGRKDKKWPVFWYCFLIFI